MKSFVLCLLLALSAANGAAQCTFLRTDYPVGPGPYAVLSQGAYIWVTNHSGGTVSKLRAGDGTIVGTFPVGRDPSSLAYDGANIWVANINDNTVTKLQASDGTNLGTFAAGNAPNWLEFDGTSIWVTDYLGRTLTQLRTGDGTTLATYHLPWSPAAVLFDGTNLWTTEDAYPGSNSAVRKIRPSDGAVLGVFPLGGNGRGMAFDGANVWATNVLTNTVSKLRASDGANLGTFPANGVYPFEVAFDGSSIWVTNNSSNNVVRLRTSDGANLATCDVGATPVGVAFDGTNIWVANQDSGTVSRLSAQSSPSLAAQAAARAQTLLGRPYGFGGKGFDYLSGLHGSWVDADTIGNGFTNRSTLCQQPTLSQTACGGYNYYACNPDRTDEVVQGVCDGKLHRDWGIDCSGLVMWSYNTASGATKFQDNNFIQYPNAQGQYQNNVLKTPLAFADLQPGDLLFFNYHHACDATITKNTTDRATCTKTVVDHVVMYVGGGNTVEAHLREAGDGVIPSTVPARSTMDPKKSISFLPCDPDPQQDTKPCFAGYRRPQHAPVGMKTTSGSPIGLIVTDSDGLTITPDTLSLTDREVLREVNNQLYYIVDSDFDDTVIAPTLKSGDYLINVVPKPNTVPTDTYSLTVEAAGTTLTLARNIPISDIPTLGYGFESTGSAIRPLIPVGIDIKPGSSQNPTNLTSKGTIPVAILSNSSFNAVSQVDVNSLRFGRTGTEPSLAFCNSRGEDVNGDGLPDLVCHFYTEQTGFQAGDTKGILKGLNVGGELIRGVDSIQIVP